MENKNSHPENHNVRYRALYFKVAKHWHDELVNSDTSDEWLTEQGRSSHSIVRKMTYELKQKSEACHELLRSRLSDLNLSLNEDEAFHQVKDSIQPYGIFGKLEELYSSNSILVGKSEELIVAMREINDDRTASLLARMRNLQLERHQLYARFFQPGHVAFEVNSPGTGGLGDN